MVESANAPMVGTLTQSVVERPHLSDALDRGLTGAVTLLVAPAGYGKTTVLDQWRQRHPELHAFQLILKAKDNDPIEFIHTLEAIAGVAVTDADVPLTYRLANLLRTLACSLDGPMVLILDDFHLLIHQETIEAIDSVLELPNVKFVIASRTVPSLARLSKLRIEGQTTLLDATVLRFSSYEATELLARYGSILNEKELQALLQRTEGWPAAVRLFCQALQRDPKLSAAEIIASLTGARQELFDYLAQQVFERLPSEIRSFLGRVALLPFVTPTLCNAVLDIDNALALLDALERNQLFLTRVPGSETEYRLHALFREFLCHWLEKEQGAAVVNGVRRRIAAHFLDHRAYDHAIEQLVAAQDWDGLTEALEKALDPLLDRGQFVQLAGWLETFPSSISSQSAFILYAFGRVQEMQGRYADSQKSLERAGIICSHQGLPPRIGQNIAYWHAFTLMRLGRYADSIQTCRDILETIGEHHPLLKANLHTILAGCYTEGNDLARGERHFEQALRLYRSAGDPTGEARVLHNMAINVLIVQGHLYEAIEAEKLSMWLFEEINSYRRCFALYGLAQALILICQFDEANEYLEQLITQARTHADPALISHGLFLRGHLYREQGKLNRADEAYREALTLATLVRDPTTMIEPRLGLALLCLEHGERIDAKRYAQEALESAETYGAAVLEGKCHLVLARIADCFGNPATAEIHFHQAIDRHQTQGAAYYLAEAQLYFADFLWRRGRVEDAFTCLTTAVASALDRGFEFLFTVHERAITLPLLVHCFVLKGQAGDQVATILMRMGKDAIDVLQIELVNAPRSRRKVITALLDKISGKTLLTSDAPTFVRPGERRAEAPLRIYALSEFELWRGEIPVNKQEWPRRKAKLLLLYLLTNRDRPVSNEELAETLWPELSTKSALLALNTTYSDLRRILDPTIAQRSASRYIARSGKMLQFIADCPYWYDVESFELAAKNGGSDLEKAPALYRGDFLPEEPYTEWVLAERDRLRGLFREAMLRLLTTRLMAEQWTEAIQITDKILAREPWVEEAWQASIRAYTMMGRRAKALEAYRACERALRVELDAEPCRETRLLIASINTT